MSETGRFGGLTFYAKSAARRRSYDALDAIGADLSVRGVCALLDEDGRCGGRLAYGQQTPFCHAHKTSDARNWWILRRDRARREEIQAKAKRAKAKRAEATLEATREFNVIRLQLDGSDVWASDAWMSPHAVSFRDDDDAFCREAIRPYVQGRVRRRVWMEGFSAR